ncbi:MAG: hypothetical protein LBU04_04470 [Christensenellaceae bacterium]|nr:hypothetical protein [Christensenellaceae bacterium]
MKRKVLLLLLSCILIFSVIFLAVACKTPTKKPIGDNKGTVDPGEEDEGDPLPSGAAEMFQSIDNLVLKATDLSETNKLHGAGTLFFEINDLLVEIKIDASFDGVIEANNKAFVQLTVTDSSKTPANVTNYLTIYVEDDVIYIGESITQKAESWFKLEQAKEAKILTFYLASLPAELVKLGDSSLVANGITSSISDMVVTVLDTLPIYNAAGTEKEHGYDTIDGHYQFELLFTAIGPLLPTIAGAIPGEGKLSEKLSNVAGSGLNLLGLVNIASNILINTSITDLESEDEKEVDYPYLGLAWDIEDEMLSSLRLNYENESLTALGIKVGRVKFSLGLKDLTVNNVTTNVKKPDRFNKNSIGNAYITANIKVELPSKSATSNGSGTSLELTAFANPALNVLWNDATEKDYPVVDFTGLEAWVEGVIKVNDTSTYVYGQYLYDETKDACVLALDLTGLLEYLTIDEINSILGENAVSSSDNIYYFTGFDFATLFGASTTNGTLPEDLQNADETPQASKNLLDKVIDNLSGLFTEFNIIDLVNTVSVVLELAEVNVIPALTEFKNALGDNLTDDSVFITLDLIRGLIGTEKFKFLSDSTYIGSTVKGIKADPLNELLILLNDTILKVGDTPEADNYVEIEVVYAVVQAVTGVELLPGLDLTPEMIDAMINGDLNPIKEACASLSLTDAQLAAAKAKLESVALEFSLIRPDTNTSGIGFSLALQLATNPSATNKTYKDAVRISVTIDIVGGNYADVIAAHGYTEERANMSNIDGALDLASESENDDKLLDILLAAVSIAMAR